MTTTISAGADLDERTLCVCFAPGVTTLSASGVQELFPLYVVSNVEIKQDTVKQQLSAYVSFQTAADAVEALAGCKHGLVTFADGTQARVILSSRNTTLHVSNLDLNTTDEAFAALFARFMPVDEPPPTLLRKPSNNVPGQTVCYGTVAFASRADAERAVLATNNSSFGGRRIKVAFYRHSHNSGRSTPSYSGDLVGDERGASYRSYAPAALAPSVPAPYQQDAVISVYVVYGGAVDEEFFVELFQPYGAVTGVYIKGCTSSLDAASARGYAGRCVALASLPSLSSNNASQPSLTPNHDTTTPRHHDTTTGRVGTPSCISRTQRPAAAPRCKRAA